LTTKYLNMYQILKDTKSDNKTTYDKEFVLRNSFSRKNQIKAKLFSLNGDLYSAVNRTSKNVPQDISLMFKNENIKWTLIFILAVLVLSRFFDIYTGAEDGFVNTVYIWLSRMAAVVVLTKYVPFWLKNKKVSLSIVVGMFYTMLFLISILNGGDLRCVLSLSYPIVALVMLLEMSISANYKQTIIILNYLFTFLLTVNFLQMLLFNNSIAEHYYLLGGRNQIGILMIIALFVSYLYSKERNFDLSFWYTMILSLLSTFLGGSINNMVALLVIFAFGMLERHGGEALLERIDIAKTVVTYGIFSFLLIVVEIQNFIAPFIVNVLGRSATFSGRTILWGRAIFKIKSKPLFGYGRSVDNAYFWRDNRTYSAHNTFLQTTYEYGIFPVLVLIGIVYYYGKKINTKELGIFNGCLFALLIVMGMESIGMDALFVMLSLAVFYSEVKGCLAE